MAEVLIYLSHFGGIMTNINVSCKHCDGTGITKNPQKMFDEKGAFRLTTQLCLKCHGEGELDWVENVVGKKSRSDLFLKAMEHPTTHIKEKIYGGTKET